jgi:DNA-directed RNA polymerase subunit M/transcription elongation factor TFIIS
MGFNPNDFVCPKCDSNAIHFLNFSSDKLQRSVVQCLACGHVWPFFKNPIDQPPTPPREG